MTTGQKMSRKGRENIRRGLKKYYARRRREAERSKPGDFELPEETASPTPKGLGLTSVRTMLDELSVGIDELDATLQKLSGLIG